MRRALLFVLAAFVGGFFGGCYEEGTRDRPGIASVVAPAMDSVVAIHGYKRDPVSGLELPDGMGSGVQVRSDGYIITCNHVVAGDSRLEVDIAPGRKAVPAVVVVQDPERDLALIKVAERLYDAVRWGDSDSLSPGDSLFAVGYPFDVTKTCETGIVSAVDQVIFFPVITTNAAINPGMSGGGAFDFTGRLIGMPVAIYSAEGLRANTGVAYLIPGNVARRFCAEHLPRG